MTDETHKGLPVAGYLDQTSRNVAHVNENKELEERVLRRIEALRGLAAVGGEVYDARMLALATTGIQEAFMWMNRAIFRPGRVGLPEDAQP